MSVCDLLTYSPGQFKWCGKLALGEYNKPEAFGPNCPVQYLNKIQNLSVFRMMCFEVIISATSTVTDCPVGILYYLAVVLVKLIQPLLLYQKYRTLQFVKILPKYAVKMCISSNFFGIVLSRELFNTEPECHGNFLKFAYVLKEHVSYVMFKAWCKHWLLTTLI